MNHSRGCNDHYFENAMVSQITQVPVQRVRTNGQLGPKLKLCKPFNCTSIQIAQISSDLSNRLIIRCETQFHVVDLKA